MNEWKKKCVGLQRTWVSKRTVAVYNVLSGGLFFGPQPLCYFTSAARLERSSFQSSAAPKKKAVLFNTNRKVLEHAPRFFYITTPSISSFKHQLDSAREELFTEVLSFYPPLPIEVKRFDLLTQTFSTFIRGFICMPTRGLPRDKQRPVERVYRRQVVKGGSWKIKYVFISQKV